jgi:hypothetical protein
MTYCIIIPLLQQTYCVLMHLSIWSGLCAPDMMPHYPPPGHYRGKHRGIDLENQVTGVPDRGINFDMHSYMYIRYLSNRLSFPHPGRKGDRVGIWPTRLAPPYRKLTSSLVKSPPCPYGAREAEGVVGHYMDRCIISRLRSRYEDFWAGAQFYNMRIFSPYTVVHFAFCRC